MTQKRMYIIGGSLFILGLLYSCVSMYIQTKAELHAKALESAHRSIALFEQSKEDYCSVFRSYLSSCNGGRSTRNCNILEGIETEYWDIFEAEAKDDCMQIVHNDDTTENMETEIATPEAGIPAGQKWDNDPLFFDDSVTQ